MTFTGRRLPHGEWNRLSPTELGPWRAHLDPKRTTFAAVDDAAGNLAGTWGMLWIPHAEGVWIAPEYRGNPAVVRRLTSEMSDIAREEGVSRLMTASMDAATTRLLARLEADVVPGQHFAFNVDRLPRAPRG